MVKSIHIISFLFITALLSGCLDDPSPKYSENNRPKRSQPSTKSPEKSPPIKKIEVKDPESVPVPTDQLNKAKEIMAEVSPSDVAKIDAKNKFRNLCATCHGFKGDLYGSGTKELARTTYNVEEMVALTYFGRGTMTPYRALLNSEELVAVAQYIEDEIKR